MQKMKTFRKWFSNRKVFNISEKKNWKIKNSITSILRLLTLEKIYIHMYTDIHKKIS